MYTDWNNWQHFMSFYGCGSGSGSRLWWCVVRGDDVEYDVVVLYWKWEETKKKKNNLCKL